jgi:excinuclease UvrABC nuclease subunit
VYELKAFGELVYIGRASNLRRRLLEHLGERNPNYYRYETAGLFQRPSSLEKHHLNAYGNSVTEMPPWNSRDPRL